MVWFSAELPGFYYDSGKNRYFPYKGPIPGSFSKPSSLPSLSEPKQCLPKMLYGNKPRSVALDNDSLMYAI